jgi:hypothetical protein
MLIGPQLPLVDDEQEPGLVVEDPDLPVHSPTTLHARSFVAPVRGGGQTAAPTSMRSATDA